VGSHAACALSGPFSWQCEKGKENRWDTIFFEKNQLFLILISEFQENPDGHQVIICCVAFDRSSLRRIHNKTV
jgi:hypothetical protein